MSSKTDSTLLIPGPDGWELWQGSREQGFRRALENGPMLASGIEKIPAGRLLMAFPVREALAVPFKVQTEDQTMFEDLASMHLEKSGISPEVEAGRLTDVFFAGGEEGQSTLLSVVLSAPDEGSMPLRAPNQFDMSARFFQMADNAVTLWRELGRWVFAITSNAHLTYFQSLPGSELGADAIRDIRLALTQLSLQGVNLEMDKAVVWTSGQSSDPSDEQIQVFGKELEAEVSAEPKPRPVVPDPISRLVPADVRAEQKLRAEKQKRNLIIAAILVVYLGIAGYLGYDYYQLNNTHKKQQAELKEVKRAHADIALFNADWDQLAPVVDSQHWPLQLLDRSFRAIPPGPPQNMRFKVFEATRLRITIRGEANDLKLTSSYAEKLRRTLPDYDWSLPPAESDNKTNRWKFNYEGTLKGESTE
ncbi:MAG: hypothetical protein KJO79_07290 [Verrucomicrobiae bacterium]|nr:hypothetical protein [Verrucomicrobiae bacterium]NNJ86966.1 hypothetical protein [Akkermansiaceae bacterium]